MRKFVITDILGEISRFQVRWNVLFGQISPSLKGPMPRKIDRNHLGAQVDMPRWRAVLLISLTKIDDFLAATQPAIDDPVERATVADRFPLLRPGTGCDVSEDLTCQRMVGF